MKALFLVLFVLAMTTTTTAQAATQVLYVSASASTYTAAGQTITYTYTFNTGTHMSTGFSITAEIDDISANKIVSLSPVCTGLPAGMNATITCTASYTTTATNVTQQSFQEWVSAYSASYNGSTWLTGSQSVPVTLTANYAAKASTTTSLSASPASSSTFSQSVTLTATVSGTSPAVPTGTVTFKDGSTTLGTGTLNGSGVASYSTSALAVGSHSITAAYGGDGSNSSSTSTALSYSVVSPPSITTSSLPNAIVGSSYSTTLSASGGSGSYTWSASGLPAGLSLNSSTGVISGTPTSAGAASVKITATDGSATATKTLSLTVYTAVSITTSSLPSGTVGSSYSTNLSANGGTGTYTWSASGLPAGLSVNSSNGVISGTPTSAGTSSVKITATDGNSTATKTLSLTVYTAVSITTSSLPDAAVGSSYSTTLSASGGTGTYTWSASGLPAGLSLNSSTGAISGTPTSAGTASAKVTATDGNSTATKTLSLTVYTAVSITTSNLPSGTVGSSYSTNLSANGGTGTYTWSASGLPAGLSLNTSTGVISGTPTSSGASNVKITVTDGNSTAAKTLLLTIHTAVSITTTSLPNATVGSSYSTTLSASGGTGSYTWSSTTLPAGLSLNSSTGVIAGTPTAVGTVNFTVTVIDTAKNSATHTYSGFTVAKASPGISLTESASSVVAGAPVTFTAALSGGVSPTGSITFKDGTTSLSTVTLSGLSASYSTKSLAAGSHSITAVYSGDSVNGAATSSSISLTVTNRPNPAADPTVVALLTSQMRTAQSYGQTQINNVSQRLAMLHSEMADGGSGSNGLDSSGSTSIGTPSANTQSAPSLVGSTGNGRAYSGQSKQTASLDIPSLQWKSTSANEQSRNFSKLDPSQIVDIVSTAFERVQNHHPLRFHVWATGTLNFGTVRNTGAADNRFSTRGITLGFDRLVSPDLGAGVAFGIGSDHSDIGSDGSYSDSTARTFTVYGSWRMAPRTFLDLQAGIGSMSFNDQRWSSSGNVMLSGSRRGHDVHGSVGLSRLGRRGSLTFSPYGRIDVVRATLDGYTETGSGIWALSYGKVASTTVSSVIGLTADYTIERNWGQLVPGARIEYRHAFTGGFTQSLGYADLGTQPYEISGLPSTKNELSAGISLRVATRGNVDVDLEYLYSTDFGASHNQQVSATVHFTF